jgi:hypothetical protein
VTVRREWLAYVLPRRRQPTAESEKTPNEEFRVKIKVKKVEPIEATRIHLDPDAPQGAV